MNNLKTLLISIIFSSFLLVVSNVRAQTSPTPTPFNLAKQTEVYRCLDATWCGDHPDKCGNPPRNEAVHMAALVTKEGASVPVKDDRGQQLKHYVLEVVILGDGRLKATTGDATTDAEIGLCDEDAAQCTTANANYTRLSQDRLTRYTFRGMRSLEASSGQQFMNAATALENPLLPDIGKIGPLIWISDKGNAEGGNPREGTSSFFYDYYRAPEVTSRTTVPGSHVQGTFVLTAGESNCDIVRWDPYGKAFDTQSMEPLPGTVVTLKKDRGNNNFTKVEPTEYPGQPFPNPQTTKEGGDFSFNVVDGDYLLEAIRNGYVFAQPSAGTAPLPLKREDIYTDVYRGEPIMQRDGVMQHRNIPMDPLPSVTPYVAANVTLMDPKAPPFYDSLNDATIFKLLFSHPFTKVDFYAENIQTGEERFLYTKYTDLNGWIEESVSHELLMTGEKMGDPVAQKPDLTQGRPQAKTNIIMAFLQKLFRIGEVEAQTVTGTGVRVEHDPILRYVEGCAYDANKRALPAGTTVGVYPTFSNSPYYTTSTDADGCFRITSDHLPSFPYILKYRTVSGAVIKDTTSSFLEKNKEYIAQKNIDVNKYKDSEGNTMSPERKAALDKNDENMNPGNGANNAGPNSNFLGNQTNNPAFMVGLIILLLVLGVAGLVFALYLYKRNRTTL